MGCSPWGREESGRLNGFIFTFHSHALEKEMQPTPVFLPGESQGRGSLVGCRLQGRTESDTTERLRSSSMGHKRTHVQVETITENSTVL